MKFTSIGVKEEIKDAITKLKNHPRETYSDVLERLLEKAGHSINKPNPLIHSQEPIAPAQAEQRS